ncbi:hypothetical protein DMX03_27225 [Pseudomonas koreensis]|nr:hypothetical protein DMX03_27225 [Pseudomonas koreensis]
MKKGGPSGLPFLFLQNLESPVGASLLAKALCQPTNLPDVKPPSRAGSLPQFERCCLQMWDNARHFQPYPNRPRP